MPVHFYNKKLDLKKARKSEAVCTRNANKKKKQRKNVGISEYHCCKNKEQNKVIKKQTYWYKIGERRIKC